MVGIVFLEVLLRADGPVQGDRETGPARVLNRAKYRGFGRTSILCGMAGAGADAVDGPNCQRNVALEQKKRKARSVFLGATGF